jgi:hypothetical protein
MSAEERVPITPPSAIDIRVGGTAMSIDLTQMEQALLILAQQAADISRTVGAIDKSIPEVTRKVDRLYGTARQALAHKQKGSDSGQTNSPAPSGTPVALEGKHLRTEVTLRRSDSQTAALPTPGVFVIRLSKLNYRALAYVTWPSGLQEWVALLRWRTSVVRDVTIDVEALADEEAWAYAQAAFKREIAPTIGVADPRFHFDYSSTARQGRAHPGRSADVGSGGTTPRPVLPDADARETGDVQNPVRDDPSTRDVAGSEPES